jgi:hypothetical protein
MARQKLVWPIDMDYGRGTPLSPQLFILVMEALHFALEKATQLGHLAPLADTGL